MKTLAFIHRNDSHFSVGDFNPVVSVFSHYELGNTVSPFLLLDHIGPGMLKPSQLRKGVEEHPHRGFETVTFVYEGELEHWDSQGGGGVIQKGDVQWMTAASGIIHKEKFSESFSREGGRFEMIQLWVNLPATAKKTNPRYQSLLKSNIPVVDLAHDVGTARVIAGAFMQVQGPALVHSPLLVLDLDLKAGHTLTLPAGHLDTTLMYMRRGKVEFGTDDELLTDQGMAVFSSHGENVEFTTLSDSKILYLMGQPLNEPLVGRGFYVMNTQDEIVEAIEEMKHGTFLKSHAIDAK
ncbi:pirin family protein [Acinetobacter sp. Ver3]|uniref:pirin family protein n=1 Tax=Acinetobacter sp. Ver3 TaxID=466088 RepID=UPI00044DD7BC|nr:pirin family protein [Acinetobacter sp. Ver3]EZQ12225.1 pirin [Acinetobacter sp. Ver3]